MKFIDDYVAYASRICDAPTIYHKFMARAIIGIMSENKVYYELGATRIFNNFWMLFFGTSSKFRKSTSIRIGVEIMKRVVEDVVLPSSFSPESLYPILQERKSGAFFFSEFKTLVEMLRKDYMGGADSILTELYDVLPVWTRTLRKERFRVVEPTISILGATTFSWFVENIRRSEIEGGYLPRYLVVVARHKEHDFFPGDDDEIEKNKLVKELHGIREFINTVGKKKEEEVRLQLKFDEAGRAKYIDWLHEFEKKLETESLLVPFLSRLTVYVIKLAMIEALNEYSDTIKLEHLEKALELAKFVEESLGDLKEREMSFTPYEKDLKRVLKVISAKPAGIARGKLIGEVNLHARDLNSIINALIESGRIKDCVKKQKHSDKPTTFYVINENKL